MTASGGCGGCNVLDVHGSFVHVEQLTIQNATRALRFQTDTAEANVVRRGHTRDVARTVRAACVLALLVLRRRGT